MTKGELLKVLEPFDDGIEIIVRNGYEWRTTISATYAQREGEGIAAIVLGDRARTPVMVRCNVCQRSDGSHDVGCARV